MWTLLVAKAPVEYLLLNVYFFKIQPLVQFFHVPSCQSGTEQGHTSEQLLESTITH